MDFADDIRRFRSWRNLLTVVFIAAIATRLFLYFDIAREPDVFRWTMSLIVVSLSVGALHQLSKLPDGKFPSKGVYKYMRHPLHTVLFLMDLKYWFIPEYSVTFFVSAAVLYLTIIFDARLRANEMSATFGDDAEEYLQRTPAIVLMYPFRSR